MKKLLLFFAYILLIFSCVFSQQVQVNMSNDFKQIASFNKGRAITSSSIQTYSSNEIIGSQFFYPSFSKGSVTNYSNEFFSTNYLFLFDKVRQELFIKYTLAKNNDAEILLADKSQIKRFSIYTDKEHLFLSSFLFDSTNNKYFYELLQGSSLQKISVLKLVQTTFVKMDKADMQKMKDGNFSDEFKDKISYFLSFESSKPKEIKLSKKNILLVIPDNKKNKANQYFIDNPDMIIDELFLSNFVTFINQ